MSLPENSTGQPPTPKPKTEDHTRKADRVPNVLASFIKCSFRRLFKFVFCRCKSRVRRNVTGAIGGFFTAGAAFYYNNPHTPLLIVIFMLLIGGLSLAFAARQIALNYAVSIWANRWWWIVFLAYCALASGTLCIEHRIPAPSDRPILEPLLVIDSVTETNVLYHYEVTNTGKEAGVVTSWSDSGVVASGLAMWMDFGGRYMKAIKPGATIQLRPPIEHVALPDFLWQRTLKLKYQADPAHQIDEWFRFDVFRDVLKTGSFHYDSSGNDSGVVQPFNDIRGALRGPSNSVWFAMNQTNNGMPRMGLVIGNGSNRIFAVNPVSHKVRFVSKTPLGRESDLTLPLPSGDFNVMLSWNDFGAMLAVNGQTICDPTNFMAESSSLIKAKPNLELGLMAGGMNGDPLWLTDKVYIIPTIVKPWETFSINDKELRGAVVVPVNSGATNALIECVLHDVSPCDVKHGSIKITIPADCGYRLEPAWKPDRSIDEPNWLSFVHPIPDMISGEFQSVPIQFSTRNETQGAGFTMTIAATARDMVPRLWGIQLGFVEMDSPIKPFKTTGILVTNADGALLWGLDLPLIKETNSFGRPVFREAGRTNR